MPGHIYMQTGRYADAFTANINAIQADEGYVTACRAQGIYPLAYYPHNIHFLAWAAIMQGRKSEALAAPARSPAASPASSTPTWRSIKPSCRCRSHDGAACGMPSPRSIAVYFTKAAITPAA
jgi:hypothetical protein